MNESGQHVEDKKEYKFTGNLMFCSTNVCRGSNLSRRDDIESIIYLLIHLLSRRRKRELPWLKCKGEEKTVNLIKIRAFKAN